MPGEGIGHSVHHEGVRPRISLCEQQMIDRVHAVMGGQHVTQIARQLSMNHESVRRYLLGTTSAPAMFPLRIAANFEVDGHWLLTGRTDRANAALRAVSTSQLLAEIKRRAETVDAEGFDGHTRSLSEWERVALLCAASTPAAAGGERRTG